MILKYCIKEFIDEKKFQNISPKTLRNYSETLKQFYSFAVEKEIIEVTDITPRVIKSYLNYCRDERNNNPVSLNSKLLILKVFFNYLEHEELITTKENATSKIAYLKTDVNMLHITRFQNHKFSLIKPPIRSKETTSSLISTAPKGGTYRFVF